MLSTPLMAPEEQAQTQIEAQVRILKQIAIIKEIQKICEGRIAYNQSIKSFLESGHTDAINQYLDDKFFWAISDPEERQRCLTNIDLMERLRVSMVAACLDDCKPYKEAINKIIQTSSTAQTVIDRLYFHFKTQYDLRFSEESSSLRQTKETNRFNTDFLESSFLERIKDLLEDKTSQPSKAFFKHHNFVIQKEGQSTQAIWLPKTNKIKEIVDFLESFSKKKDSAIESLNSLPEFSPFVELLNVFYGLKEEINFFKNERSQYESEKSRENINFELEYSLDVFETFIENYLKYLHSKELEAIITRCLQFTHETQEALKPKKDPKKEQKTKPKKDARQKKAGLKKGHLEEKPQIPDGVKARTIESAFNHSVMTEEAPIPILSETIPTPTLTEAQKRALAYKTEVLKERAQKKAREDAERTLFQATRLDEETQKKQREASGEALLEVIAFERLERLSPENLDRLNRILSTDGSIRYTEVQALIGQASHQLKGSITGAQGGSHRTITLDPVKDAPALLGYFDDLTAKQPEAKQPSSVQNTEKPMLYSTQALSTVKGGIPQEHGGAHAGKMNPFTQRMLVGIFERACITAARLEKFRAAKAICLEQGIERPSVEQLLEQLMYAARDSSAPRPGI